MYAIAMLSLLLGVSLSKETGNHPEWDRWCGKAYEPEYPSFNPGGQTVEPRELRNGPALNVHVAPRYGIYLESEEKGEFIVSTEISKWFGQSWPSLESPQDAPQMSFTISISSSQNDLVSDNISVGRDAETFSFNLNGLKASFDPYNITLSGSTADGSHKVSANTQLYVLPEKKTGSVTKLDNLKGGMLFRNSATNGKFVPFLPYGFYASCDGFLCADDYQDQIKAYQDLGLNAMVSLTTIEDSRDAYEYLDQIGLKYMYDLRGYYQNLTAVREQVTAIRDFGAIYSYWGADEPDGHQDPFNATVLSRDLIRSIDPYHPVSVTLNCQNFYFEEYTSGADFVMEDVYPIGINTSSLSKWGTPCNTTYGDCGCDNCIDTEGVRNVPSRLDDLIKYEKWTDTWPRKTMVHNPQSFHGEGYWSRDPTEDEEVAMNALGFNHGAKSIMSWVWPTTDTLAKIHGEFASVVASEPVRDFIVSNAATRIDVPEIEFLDVASWIQGDDVLFSVVYSGDQRLNQTVKIPVNVDGVPKVKSIIWGDAAWSTSGGVLQLEGVEAMSTNMAIISS